MENKNKTKQNRTKENKKIKLLVYRSNWLPADLSRRRILLPAFYDAIMMMAAISSRQWGGRHG